MSKAELWNSLDDNSRYEVDLSACEETYIPPFHEGDGGDFYCLRRRRLKNKSHGCLVSLGRRREKGKKKEQNAKHS